MPLRVVQVGDVAYVAPALAAALQGVADVVSLPLRQRAAQSSGLAKLAMAPMRVWDAAWTARRVMRHRPHIAHIHWVPNGLVGLFLPVPWIVHCHGTDIRGLNRLRRVPYAALLRRADGVVYATPDLARFVLPIRADAVHLPVPIPQRTAAVPPRWDLLIASRALPIKGSAVAFEAVRRLRETRPGLRAAAVDGPSFEPFVERLPFIDKESSIARIAAARVVLGQFRLGALGVTELEAMSLGRPVITWVEQLDPADPPPVRSERTASGIARAAAELLDDPAEADRLGRAGRDWVGRHHDPRAIADRLATLYRKILTSRAG